MFWRFDVGSGMATIRYPTAIKLGEFHTVQLYRNGTQGSIIVDDEAPINGTSQVRSLPFHQSGTLEPFCYDITVSLTYDAW